MITELKPNQVFVFGSNTKGRHGKGAALQAHKQFGAEYGVGEGLCGLNKCCYAFPTLNHYFQKVRVTDLVESRDLLYHVCRENPDKEFLLTKVGCGLAGFSEDKIIWLFTVVSQPSNLILPEEWR